LTELHSIPASQAEMQDIELASIRQELTETILQPAIPNEFSPMSKSGRRAWSFGDVCSMSGLDRFSDSSGTSSEVPEVPED
jgi:hypothetical protein